jgi:hypothetical protein
VVNYHDKYQGTSKMSVTKAFLIGDAIQPSHGRVKHMFKGVGRYDGVMFTVRVVTLRTAQKQVGVFEYIAGFDDLREIPCTKRKGAKLLIVDCDAWQRYVYRNRYGVKISIEMSGFMEKNDALRLRF